MWENVWGCKWGGMRRLIIRILLWQLKTKKPKKKKFFFSYIRLDDSLWIWVWMIIFFKKIKNCHNKNTIKKKQQIEIKFDRELCRSHAVGRSVYWLVGWLVCLFVYCAFKLQFILRLLSLYFRPPYYCVYLSFLHSFVQL